MDTVIMDNSVNTDFFLVPEKPKLGT